MASSPDDEHESDGALAPWLRALAHAPALLARGAEVGDYVVDAPLGAGGTSTVYRARDRRDGREVALKVLHAGAATADGVARLAREARVLAALAHPHIVGLHEIGEHDGVPFLALELLAGETLRRQLRAGPLAIENALARTNEILAALAAAHDHGVVHRDLKPENLFVTTAGTLKVLDFGLAKRVPTTATAASEAATAAGLFVGTYAYMAPEQIRGDAVDARTDLFALGAVLHELVTGHAVFAAATPVETMHRILTEDAAPLDEVAPDVPPALADVVERCLARDPEARPSSAHEVAEALSTPRPRARRTTAPTTRYARAGDVHIGYQIVGDGPRTIVVVPGFVSNIEQIWEDPDSARFFRRLAAGARVVLFDKRGTGVSDRVLEPRARGVEHRVDDLRVILDEVGVERAALLGVSEGAPIATRFAVTYPDRVTALALYGGYATYRPHAGIDAVTAAIRDGWGTGRTLDWFAPSVAADPRKRRWWARWERLGASPGAAAVHVELLREVDVTAVLGLVRVPTLILHRSGDRVVPVAASRYLADRIPDARYLEHPGDDHLIVVGDADAIADDVLGFVETAPPGLAPRDCAAWVATTDAPPMRVPTIDAALALRARAIHADAHPAGSPRAAAIARAVAALAAPDELLLTADVRGLICDRGLALADRGVHALADGTALRLFATPGGT